MTSRELDDVRAFSSFTGPLEVRMKGYDAGEWRRTSDPGLIKPTQWTAPVGVFGSTPRRRITTYPEARVCPECGRKMSERICSPKCLLSVKQRLYNQWVNKVLDAQHAFLVSGRGRFTPLCRFDP